MKSNYWGGVAKRLSSLGKTAFNAAAPIAVRCGVSSLVSKSCDVVEDKLRKLYKKTAVNASITFALNLAGMLFLIFRPFGKMPSLVVSLIFFVSSTVFFSLCLALWIKSYGKTAVSVTKSILKQKSIHRGIESYVLGNFPVISLAYAGIDVGSVYVPALKEVPRIPQLIDFFVQQFWKKFALYAGIVCAYSIPLYFVLKPILLKNFFSSLTV